jgi:hypothetical protein
MGRNISDNDGYSYIRHTELTVNSRSHAGNTQTDSLMVAIASPE